MLLPAPDMRCDSTDSAASFTRDWFVVVPALISDPLLGFLWRHVLAVAPTARIEVEDGLAARGRYADVVMEHLLGRLQPLVEASTGISLEPTYSYWRLYGRGDALRRHSDRPSCEISATINLGQEPSVPWPICIDGKRGVASIRLEPGDALIYRGIDADHWRDAYQGERLAQVFLHYVDKAGPHAAWRYDKRPGLHLPISLPI
jgi:hypothetical protein